MRFFGQAQMVRPLIAPMAEAAEERHGPITTASRMEIRGVCRRHGQHRGIFRRGCLRRHRIGPVMKGFLQQSGYAVAPLDLALWAIPPAILAFLIHGQQIAPPGSALEARAHGRTMIKLEHVYILAGAMFAVFAIGRALR